MNEIKLVIDEIKLSEIKSLPDPVCGYFVVSCKLFDKDYPTDPSEDPSELVNYDENELRTITAIIKKEKFPIKRGDLVRMECASKYENIGIADNYYRNDGILIYNGNELELLACYKDENGYIPEDYVLYEEPEYFNSKYWHSRPPHPSGYDHAFICHNTIVWINTNSQLVDNVKAEFIKNKMIVSTHYTDSRYNEHCIVADIDRYNNTTNIKNLQYLTKHFIEELEQKNIMLNVIHEYQNFDGINFCDELGFDDILYLSFRDS